MSTTGGETRPVVRAWKLGGEVLRRPGVAEELCTRLLARLDGTPGLLGKLVNLEPDIALMRGLSFWTDDHARVTSDQVFLEVVDEVVGLSEIELVGPVSFELCLSRFRQRPGDAGAAPPEELVVRHVVLTGGRIADPGVVDVLKTLLVEYVTEAPGCLGALMMCDPDLPQVVIGTYWDEERSADRVADMFAAAVADVDHEAASTSTTNDVVEVLVYRPVREFVR